jgi:hypothetical protein
MQEMEQAMCWTTAIMSLEAEAKSIDQQLHAMAGVIGRDPDPKETQSSAHMYSSNCMAEPVEGSWRSFECVAFQKYVNWGDSLKCLFSRNEFSLNSILSRIPSFSCVCAGSVRTFHAGSPRGSRAASGRPVSSRRPNGSGGPKPSQALCCAELRRPKKSPHKPSAAQKRPSDKVWSAMRGCYIALNQHGSLI